MYTNAVASTALTDVAAAPSTPGGNGAATRRHPAMVALLSLLSD